MPFDSDVALLGTGVAPLVAATHLLSQGKSVLILNPDFDFFLEDSELPLDPLLPQSAQTLKPERIRQSSLDEALKSLRPEFPGAVEVWSHLNQAAEGFHDPAAPHVRQRARLWIGSGAGANPGLTPAKARDLLEEAYLHASDADLHPQILEGIQAVKRFPGFAADRIPAFPTDRFHGLVVPGLCDVDVPRYRNGMLEFVRERLLDERVVCSASQIEPTPDGVRFHAGGSAHTARLRDGMLVFWTPKLTSWVVSQSHKFETAPVWPRGMRLWEEWSLVSRDPVDPAIVGIFGNLAVWAEIEGAPSSEKAAKVSADPQRLAVLMAGALVDLQARPAAHAEMNWASQQSFAALTNLCHGFLNWSRISLRGLKARPILEWDDFTSWPLARASGAPSVQVIPGSDGPLVQVVSRARLACDLLRGAS